MWLPIRIPTMNIPLKVGDIVALKKPVEWIGANEWLVEAVPVGDSVRLRHRTRRAHYTMFKLDDIQSPAHQP